MEDVVHPLDWWLQATVPGSTRPPKNRLLGFPRIPTSRLLPNLAANYRAQHVGGVGSSSQGEQGGSHVPDPIFYNVV